MQEQSDQIPAGVSPAAAEPRPPEVGRLGLVITYPNREVLVMTVAGDIDLASVDRLAEVLWPRLSAAVQAVVVDLSQVGFLSLDGVELLNQGRLQARARGLALRLVITNHEIHRAVTVAGLDQHLPCLATVPDAVGAHRGNT